MRLAKLKIQAVICALALSALSLCAQSGSIVRTTITTITATAVNAGNTSTMVCVFTNPAPPALHTVCTVNGAVRLTSDVDVQVGSNIGSGGAYVEGGNEIGWIFKQPTANTFTYDVVANGQHSTGNF